VSSPISDSGGRGRIFALGSSHDRDCYR